MLNSSKIAIKIPEERIPPIPEFSENELRALLAIYIEKTEFDEKNYKNNIKTIFSDFKIINFESQTKILKGLIKYLNLLKIVFDKIKKEEKGIYDKDEFEFIAKPYIYFDDEDFQWKVDIKKLQEREGDYSNFNLYEGQVIFKFNPKEKGVSKLIVNNKDFEIRKIDSQNNNFIYNLLNGLSLDEEDDEELKVKYKDWDKFTAELKDSDVVIVYNDGEEILRL